ncbi:hypothetical protein ACGFX4_17550 [Kitasatospora sp. NPDC048365]|uniref:hypothetical protein n=1 Tax=Kitasatospora sp. NPDC048365 TaxID=3364050 RepID=UPI003720664F
MSGRTVRIRRRALRTAGVLGLLAAVTAGAVLSADPGDPPVRVADTSSATPEIPVDPLTGGPSAIDPTAATGGAKAAVAGSDATARAAAGGAGAVTAQAAAADGDTVTVKGSGEFAGLEVTVSQTTHLVNQVVTVSWKGGTPTVPSPMVFGQHYLSLMQCWGDGDGPDRTQCQYGATRGDDRGGAFVPSRQLSYGRTLVDPLEPIKAPSDTQNAYVPFRPVTGQAEETNGSSQYYDIQSTNEVPYAPTRADGTGQVFFEVETGMEAPGLGCGQTPEGQPGPFTEGRRCWLVVVPRGGTEVDGQPPVGQSGKLQSSPLSTTNWAKRLVVPLHFEPIGIACPIASERPTAGTELAAEMIWRWQPTLCGTAGGAFSYTQVTDDLARNRLVRNGDSGLVLVGEALPKAEQVEDRTPVYAPLAVSGLVIAFDIESQSYSRTPPATRLKDGQRITDVSLTPRLAAKLLTQSYRFSVNPGDPDVPANNPLDLTSDPEFTDLNPQFKELYFPARIAELLLPVGDGDSARAVWRWILADPDAKAFLQGAPGPHGETVNPNFKPDKVELPRPNYPKPDIFCVEYPDDPSGRPKWCNLDGHPYANNLRDAARSTARGDTLARSVWDASTIPGSLKKAQPQAQGLRGVMAVTTTALAARYGLNTAKLRNSTGQFVTADNTTMLAAAASAPAGENPVVKVVDPAKVPAGGYPLTAITYGAAVPSSMDRAAGKAYADLIRYGMGDGQQPGIAAGRLPDGYAPLPQELRSQALAAAGTIEQRAGIPEGAAATPAPPAGGGSEAVSAGGGSRPPAQGGGGAQDAPAPASTAPAHTPTTLAPAPPAAPVARTAGTDVGDLRYLLLGALIAGVLAAAAGVVVPRVLRNRRH